MQKCIDRYLLPRLVASNDKFRVLDLGGADVNGNYRSQFSTMNCEYLTADIDPMVDVDILLRDPYQIPLADESVDIVVSGQMLEHCEFFWQSFLEMMRVVKPSGFLFLIAPSAGAVHRYPVDCYRFYPDAYHALAKFADCRLIDVWMDERGPWRDLTGVFSKSDVPRYAYGHGHEVQAAPQLPPEKPTAPELEITSGQGNYLSFLESIQKQFAPRTYLEIGVRNGNSLRLATCDAMGIDVAPTVAANALPGNARLFSCTSDEFFEFEATRSLRHKVDLAFIDGMHLFEYALRDFMNIERHCSPCSLIVVDDVLPCHPVQAARHRASRVWMGDVWKLHDCLSRYRPDLFCLFIDTSPSGLLLVAGVSPTNKQLWNSYNPIVRHYTGVDEVPDRILQRRNAVRPDDSRIGTLLDYIRESRTTITSGNLPMSEMRTLFPESLAGSTPT